LPTRTCNLLQLPNGRAGNVVELSEPLKGAPVQLKSYVTAFALFRLFDIWKPPPVRQLEALPEGTGIVADDVMAGCHAALVLFLAGCFNLY
jgi:phosphatidylglycerophosphatase A